MGGGWGGVLAQHNSDLCLLNKTPFIYYMESCVNTVDDL